MIAAIYSRKSRLSDKGESIKNQIELCKAYGRNLGITDFVIYEDEGFSGGNINRPNFKKLMDDLKKKRFNYLICYKLDRVSRNVADFSATIKKLEKYDVNFVSVKEQFDTTSIMGRAMMNVSATFAQMEREVIAERIKDNMLELSKLGRWLGGTPPLGYRSTLIEYESNGKNKKMYKLDIVENEINIVREIYALFLHYRSCTPVARHLCSNHIKGKNGGDFSRNTVLQIIKNPVYCIADENILDFFRDNDSVISDGFTDIDGKNGLMVYNKRKGGKKDNPIEDWIIALGKHEGVINSEDWIRCQRILEENATKNSPRQGSGNKFLLSGLIKCGNCGFSYCSWSNNNKRTGKYERYYRCELKNRASDRCCNKMLNADIAESFVENFILNFNVDNLEKSFANAKDPSIEKISIDKQVNSLINQKNENKKIWTGLVKKLALIDDHETLEIIQEEIKAFKSTESKLDLEVNRLRLQSWQVEDSFNNQQVFIETFRSIQKSYKESESTEEKRNMLLSVIEQVTYNCNETEPIKIKLRGL